MKHIVQFSGGKDSTCMLLMMLEHNMPVDEIIFCDTGKEFPGMYELLLRLNSTLAELLQFCKQKSLLIIISPNTSK